MQICRLVLAPLFLLLLIATPSLADDAPLRDLIARFQREKSEPVVVRRKVLEEIAEVGTDRAVRFLVDVIDEDDEEFGVRSSAVIQLARVPRRSAFDALERLWKKSPDNIKINVLSATLDSRTEPGVRDMIEDALASRTANVRGRLIAWFAKSGDERFVAEADRYIADFPGHANSLVNSLVRVLTADSARLLLRIYDEKEKHHISEIPRVFTQGGEDVQRVLVEALESGDERLESNAISLVARTRAQIAEPALVALLDGAEGERLSALVAAIGAVGARTEAGRAAVLAALESKDQATAIAAAQAIRSTAPGKEPIPLLIHALWGAEGTLRTEIWVTLEQLTGQQYGDRTDLWQRWWNEHGEAFDPENIQREGRAEDVDIALVNLAVEKGVLALRSLRGEQEAWKHSSHTVGTTALVCLALHAAGLDPHDDPDLKAGLAFLEKATVPQHTYTQSLVAMALEANDARRNKSRVLKSGKALVSAQLDSGLWAYPEGEGDNSNAQYAVLGLRAAARAGMRVPERTWRRVRDHFLNTRCEDGGWSYRPDPNYPSSASMTAGGVSSLLICLENMKLDDEERAELVAAIDAGFEALGAKMKLEKDTLYTLYGVERAGILGERYRIGGKPWYAEGARRLIAEQTPDGTWTGYYKEIVETCFAILFLKKATVPVTTK